MSHAEAGTIGETITEDALETDPYPVYARLREEEPVSWVPAVELWLVTRWADVEYVDKHPALFTGETDPSTLNRTFGRNLLGSEAEYHERIRSIIYPAFRATGATVLGAASGSADNKAPVVTAPATRLEKKSRPCRLGKD